MASRRPVNGPDVPARLTEFGRQQIHGASCWARTASTTSAFMDVRCSNAARRSFSYRSGGRRTWRSPIPPGGVMGYLYHTQEMARNRLGAGSASTASAARAGLTSVYIAVVAGEL